MADALKNFAYSTVATAPSPATTGTSLVVAAGEGALFPATPFNVTVWPAGEQPTSSNAEIVRVTNVATDTLTIDREEESTTARTILVGDQIAQTVTALMVNDRLPLSGGTMTGKIFRSDDLADGDWGETGTFLKLRRVSANAPSGVIYMIDMYGQAVGTASVTDQFVGIRSFMQDASSVVNKTITGITHVSTTATVTATGHGLANGAKVAIYGVTHTFDAEVNGKWTIQNVGTDTFDIVVAGLSSGSYTNGGTVTNRPLYYAYYATVAPRVARGGLTGTAIHADDIGGFVAYNSGSAKATDGFYLGRNSGIAGSEWSTSFTSDANCDVGIGLNGAITTAVMRFPNNVPFQGMNNAGSANVSLFKINTLDELEIDAAVRFQASIIIANTVNFGFSTVTGTKFGTAVGQKIGFWNAAPIVQPGSAGGLGAITVSNYTGAARSFDRSAYTMDQLADLVCQLHLSIKTMGLVA